ncbi:MAG TPA: halocarboxylic acid dehydrogenase DehI family protein [Anaerolineae bacterium]|jgi:hypothetical protein|nr:halocarboxylic acid dehydrogenase DehI family protein [Anaerolineae bacterium]
MVNINPVREESATSDIKAIYEDIKQSLKLPWTPLIFQSFAMYPPFLQFIWHQLKPSTLTEQFRIDADRARGFAEIFVSEAHVQKYKHEDALANNLSVKDLIDIQTTLEAFHYGNSKLLLIGGALNKAIGGLSTGGDGNTESSHEDFGDRVIRKIDINPVEEEEASDDTKAIYQDIKATLGVSIINTDYKAVGDWPGFLKLAWDDLKLFIIWPSYSEGKSSLFEFAHHAADRLAYPIKMGRDEMESAGIHEEDFDAIEEMVSLFAGILPGLMLNVAEMRQVVEDLLGIEHGEFAA